MKVRILAVVVVLIAIAAIYAVVATAADKVTICHRPPGNPTNANTLSVGSSSVPAHLAQGDTLGACPVSASK